MKLLLTVLATFECSALENMASCVDGVHPHETDCSKFYQCHCGERYEDQSCPEGLLFNGELGVCDFPDNVECPWSAWSECKRVSSWTKCSGGQQERSRGGNKNTHQTQPCNPKGCDYTLSGEAGEAGS